MERAFFFFEYNRSFRVTILIDDLNSSTEKSLRCNYTDIITYLNTGDCESHKTQSVMESRFESIPIISMVICARNFLFSDKLTISRSIHIHLYWWFNYLRKDVMLRLHYTDINASINIQARIRQCKEKFCLLYLYISQRV